VIADILTGLFFTVLGGAVAGIFLAGAIIAIKAAIRWPNI